MGREASSDPHLAGHYKIPAWPVLGEAHTITISSYCTDPTDSTLQMNDLKDFRISKVTITSIFFGIFSAHCMLYLALSIQVNQVGSCEIPNRIRGVRFISVISQKVHCLVGKNAGRLGSATVVLYARNIPNEHRGTKYVTSLNMSKIS